MTLNLINNFLSKILLSVLITAQLVGFNQISTEWQPIQRIPNFEDTARAPLLVPDQAKNIHVFNYEAINASQNAIFYRKWNQDEGWTPPIDIILTGLGGGAQTLQSAFLDQNNDMHLLYYVGTDKSGSVYHTKAYITDVDNASLWTSPVVIANKADPLPFITSVQQQNGRILVFYGGQEIGNGLYLITSDDFGNTWSKPLALSLVSIEDEWPAAIQATVDHFDQVHVAWSQVSLAGVGETIFYGRLNEKQTAFEVDTIIARREGDDYSANWPTMIDSGDQLILIYMDDFPATRWMRTSDDYGDTWSIPIRPFPEVGEYEYAILNKDNDNHIHMILGNRTVEPEIHGMWYSRWVGNRWTALEPIVSGPVTSSFDPSAPQAVIAQGNLIFATWWNNVRRENLTGAWYSYKLLDSSQAEVVQYDKSNDAEISAINLEVTATSTPELNQSDSAAQPQFSKTAGVYSPAAPVFYAMIPTAILLLLFFFIRNKKRQ